MEGKILVFILTQLMLLALGGCQKNDKPSSIQELESYFNSKGRWNRFENSTLMFGESISKNAVNLLKFDEKESHKLYRKAAYKFEEDDEIVYFVYGVASSELTLSELRIRSFKNDSLVDDELIINYSKDNNLIHDYYFDDDMMVISSRDEKNKFHYSYFLFSQGVITNKTMTSDTIFSEQEIKPELGRKVILSVGFHDAERGQNVKDRIAAGRVLKTFGGSKTCSRYMIIELDLPYKGYDLVQVEYSLNSFSDLHGLHSDSIRQWQADTRCFEPSTWPIEEPKLLKEDVFVEYE
ncbi:MAG: hypothetical protein MRZ79_20430 [Bacteroidia bacterium]|nr:hypothetical protein [Bacteroidia bacterium]